MRILCVIDSLGSGGAQQQMVNLACGLKNKGHDVEVFIYHPHLDFYRPTLVEAGILVHEVLGVSGFSFRIVKSIVHLIRTRRLSALISFLPSPNTYSILARLFSRTDILLLIGERGSHMAEARFRLSLVQRFLYIFADRLVVNSFHQAMHLRMYFGLGRKVSTIYNGYALKSTPNACDRQAHVRKLLAIGRVDPGKNGSALVRALILFHNRNGYMPLVSWAGRQEPDERSLRMRAEMDRLIAENVKLQAGWQWLGERSDIPQLLANCDALIHISLHEGLPNVICEAFIAGKPVIASAVCDHPLLVEDGIRGLLCDPLSPESICSAIERFFALPAKEREVMGCNARRYAEKYLTLDRMVAEYEALLT